MKEADSTAALAALASKLEEIQNCLDQAIQTLRSLSQRKPPEVGRVSDLEEMKRKVSALREVWKSSPWWTPTEETALLAAWNGLQLLTEEHWLRLRWFFRFSDRKPEDCGGAVTGRRDAFLDNLTGYVQRALSTWTQQGKPDIGLPKAPPKAPTKETPPVAMMTENERKAAARAFREACLQEELPIALDQTPPPKA